MNRKLSLFILLVFMSILGSVATADVEGYACEAEPTDQTIGYGNIVSCAIDPVLDQDVFRFSGVKDEVVKIVISRTGGVVGNACLELTDPDGNSIGADCNLAPTNQITADLPKNGIYTIFVFESGNDELVDYNLVLERLAPTPSPNALPLEFSQILTDTIDPIVDQDLFFFGGGAGERVRITIARTNVFIHNPCIELYDPEGNLVGADCSLAPTNQITANLLQDGVYSIVAFESGNDELVEYDITLQCLSSSCAESIDRLAADFGGRGLWDYDETGWDKLTNWDPEDLVGCRELLVADFGGRGIWRHLGRWEKLTGWNPEGLVAWNGKVAADFGASGLWVYDCSAGGWSKLSSWDPSHMTAWRHRLVADFGPGRGVWLYDGASWKKLTGWDSEDLEGVSLIP